MAAGYTIKHVDEFEEMEGERGARPGRLARKSLGAESFGFNVVDIGPGGQIPSMTTPATTRRRSSSSSTADATIVTDGEEHDAPGGHLLPLRTRGEATIRNKSDGFVRALLIGVPIESGYQGMPWG